MKEPVLIVMAAGMGSRYGGLKQMDPVDEQGHAILDFSVYDAKRAGFKKVVFIIKHAIEKDFREIVGKRIEPFMEVAGVVERFTLRSTRLRALNGEIIWVHNQNITAVHVTPTGVRTIAVDIFVRDKEVGEKAIKKIIAAIPKGKTMLAKPLRIIRTEEWGENRWRITVIGQTAPGREWLIERFFVEAVIDKI